MAVTLNDLRRSGAEKTATLSPTWTEEVAEKMVLFIAIHIVLDFVTIRQALSIDKECAAGVASANEYPENRAGPYGAMGEFPC